MTTHGPPLGLVLLALCIPAAGAVDVALVVPLSVVGGLVLCGLLIAAILGCCGICNKSTGEHWNKNHLRPARQAAVSPVWHTPVVAGGGAGGGAGWYQGPPGYYPHPSMAPGQPLPQQQAALYQGYPYGAMVMTQPGPGGVYPALQATPMETPPAPLLVAPLPPQDPTEPPRRKPSFGTPNFAPPPLPSKVGNI